MVNTCCFIGDAKEESINTLIEIGQLKETANVKMLIAAGCLAQRYRKEIREQIPEVDVIIGTMAIDKIVEAVEEYQTKSSIPPLWKILIGHLSAVRSVSLRPAVIMHI